MEVIVNGQAYAGELGGDNLQEMLVDLAARAFEENITMREVKVNGRPFEERLLGPADQLPRDQVQRLEVDTIPAREMALHFLANADGYVQAISAAVPGVAELFRVGDEQEASEQYLNLLEGITLFLQMLQASKDVLGLDFDRPVGGGHTPEERLQQLSRHMNELLSAQEAQDWVLLADILEYDLLSELKLWLGFLPTLKEQALS